MNRRPRQADQFEHRDRVADLAGIEFCPPNTHLFAELLKGERVTWQRKTRVSLDNQDVVLHTEFGSFPTWIGVGEVPQSVVRAAHYPGSRTSHLPNGVSWCPFLGYVYSLIQSAYGPFSSA